MKGLTVSLKLSNLLQFQEHSLGTGHPVLEAEAAVSDEADDASREGMVERMEELDYGERMSFVVVRCS